MCADVQLAYMAKIRKEYVKNPEFDPTKVAKASSAAEGLCKWVLAMEIYDRVIKIVAPKKVKLAKAEADLAATMEKLEKKRAELKEIEARLATLQETFRNMVDEKNKLEFQVNWVGFLLTKLFLQKTVVCGPLFVHINPPEVCYDVSIYFYSLRLCYWGFFADMLLTWVQRPVCSVSSLNENIVVIDLV